VTDIRYCLLLGTVFFIAGNTSQSKWARDACYTAAAVFWITTVGIGFGFTK
jgi:hypothetical protein